MAHLVGWVTQTVVGDKLERRHFAPVPVSVQGGTADVGRGGAEGVERASVHVCGADGVVQTDGDRRRGYMIR